MGRTRDAAEPVRSVGVCRLPLFDAWTFLSRSLRGRRQGSPHGDPAQSGPQHLLYAACGTACETRAARGCQGCGGAGFGIATEFPIRPTIGRCRLCAAARQIVGRRTPACGTAGVNKHCLGATYVGCWHIAAFAAPQQFGRFRSEADNGRNWRCGFGSRGKLRTARRVKKTPDNAGASCRRPAVSGGRFGSLHRFVRWLLRGTHFCRRLRRMSCAMPSAEPTPQGGLLQLELEAECPGGFCPLLVEQPMHLSLAASLDVLSR